MFRCSTTPHISYFAFHLCPSLRLSAQILCASSLYQFSPPLPSQYHSSSLPLCLLSNWYEWVTLGPSGVKWYKVIGGSSLLTGWPLKGLLEVANQAAALPPLRRVPLPGSSAACVTWLGWGVSGRMINDAFSTCLEWSCPHHAVITRSQAAAAQHNCFLFVDLVYWGRRWLWSAKTELCTVHRGENICMSRILVTEHGWDLWWLCKICCMPELCMLTAVIQVPQDNKLLQDKQRLAKVFTPISFSLTLPHVLQYP